MGISVEEFQKLLQRQSEMRTRAREKEVERRQAFGKRLDGISKEKRPLVRHKAVNTSDISKHYTCKVGIDTGVNTGFAVFIDGHLDIRTLKIHVAMREVFDLKNRYGDGLLVRFEDARQRTWFGNAGREKLQGAGSVKRDSGIWEEFLKDYKIDFDAVPPRSNTTKMDAVQFNKLTGYMGKTSEHGRDAAMLVYESKKKGI